MRVRQADRSVRQAEGCVECSMGSLAKALLINWQPRICLETSNTSTKDLHETCASLMSKVCAEPEHAPTFVKVFIT